MLACHLLSSIPEKMAVNSALVEYCETAIFSKRPAHFFKFKVTPSLARIGGQRLVSNPLLIAKKMFWLLLFDILY